MYGVVQNTQRFVQSIIYIYIYCQEFSRNFSKFFSKRRRTHENAADLQENSAKRMISRRYRFIFLRFHLISQRNAEISSVFIVNQRKTERFAANFMQFAAVSAVFARVSRVLSAGGKTAKKDGARPLSLPKSRNCPPASRHPRERRQG